MVALQRELAGSDGAVLEGPRHRHAVFPEAPVKVFLDAERPGPGHPPGR
jgi:cytidylate kinase